MQRVFIYDCAKCYYIGARNKGFGMGDPLATYGTKSPAFQPISATRIYVLHKITIELKFMSCINSDLLIPEKKLQTPDQPQYTKRINGLDWKRVGSQQCDERDQFKSNQEHIATHIFSNLVTYVDFLQLQGYISIQQASGFGSNFARISFQKFMWLAQLHTVDIAHWVGSYLANTQLP